MQHTPLHPRIPKLPRSAGKWKRWPRKLTSQRAYISAYGLEGFAMFMELVHTSIILNSLSFHHIWPNGITKNFPETRGISVSFTYMLRGQNSGRYNLTIYIQYVYTFIYNMYIYIYLLYYMYLLGMDDCLII